MNTEKKLEVRNLTISFRTSGGKVQAVRGIDFDLYKGETLAIVGESGSGKSVTSKAILGILAGNSMIEGGEIIYDGKDLLKISEEDFHRIRGDKIAMIFQDPMSSLNPIVRIGKQLTEAMILKGKARQKESRTLFNTYLGRLDECMKMAIEGKDADEAIDRKCSNFNKFEYKHLELEKAYNTRFASATEAIENIGALSFEMEKSAARDTVYRIGQIVDLAKAAIGSYVVDSEAETLRALLKTLKTTFAAERKAVHAASEEEKRKALSFPETRKVLSSVSELLKSAVSKTEPNFFSMGYFLTFAEDTTLPDMPTDELNAYLHEYLDSHFMLAFIEEAKKGILYSAEKANLKKREALGVIAKERMAFEKSELSHAECKAAVSAMVAAVEESIDRLEIIKDGFAYTFGDSLRASVELYFGAIKKNAKEAARFEKDTAKHNALIAKGKTPKSEVVPAAITDLEDAKADILRKIDRLCEHYESILKAAPSRNFDVETIAMIDFLKECASGVVEKVTKSIAKSRAIKLMEEVGISEPRRRYNQYPFEFSGGMRQRIVIAIALAANPDILICDEPTTALDVTIQSQILELINKLKAERNLSIIFITHDLGVVANMADRIGVMYAGKIVEYGTSEDIFYHSAHPYTWALLSSMPDLDTNEKLESIPGTPPNMIYPPKGDAFAERNKYALKIDFERQPPMFKVSDTHYAATWLLHPDAPHIDPPKVIMDRIERMNERRVHDNGNE